MNRTVAIIGKLSPYNKGVAKSLVATDIHTQFKVCSKSFLPSVDKGCAFGATIRSRPDDSDSFEERLFWFADSDYVIVLPERGESTFIELALAEKKGCKIIDLYWILRPHTHKFINNDDKVKVETLLNIADYVYDGRKTAFLNDYYMYSYQDWFCQEHCK